MKELILNKFNSMPQQVEENRRNVKILYEELQKYNLTYRGLYSSENTYYKNDVVAFQKSTYIHISESSTQGITPIDTQTWALYIIGENVVITSSVKSVTQVEPDVQPTVTVETTEVEGEHVKTYDLAFSFGIPKGERGEKGENGTNGTNGTDGVSALIEGATADLTIINESETESVTVDNLGTQSNRSFAFHFNLKNGKDGTNGTNGATPLLTNINLTVDTLDAGTSAYGTAYFNQTTENVYELNMTLGIPRGNAGINSGEILNAFSADDPTKTYSVTFLNAFYNQVTSQFETVTTDVNGLKEFKTSTESNALWGNNSNVEVTPNNTNTQHTFVTENNKLYLIEVATSDFHKFLIYKGGSILSELVKVNNKSDNTGLIFGYIDIEPQNLSSILTYKEYTFTINGSTVVSTVSITVVNVTPLTGHTV